MAILFAGNSMAGFYTNDIAKVGFDTTAGRFDSTYVPGGLSVRDQGSGAKLATRHIASPLMEGWAHFETYSSVTGSSNDFGVLGLENASSVRIFEFSASNNFMTVGFVSVDNTGGGGALSGSGMSVLMDGTTLVRWDLYFKFADSGGRFQLYRDGVSVWDWTGDNLLWAHGGVAGLYFKGPDSGTTAVRVVSQVILADEDTRNLRYNFLAITGAGATNTFVGGAYTDVDENGAANDADYATSDTAAQVLLADHASMVVGKTPKAVSVNARAFTTAGAPTQAKLALRSGGVNYLSAAKTVDTGAFGPIGEVWNTDPNTSSDWSEAGVNAINSGVETSA